MTTVTGVAPEIEDLARARSARLAAAGAAWNERIAANPATAVIHPAASGTAEGGVATRIRAGGHEFVVDEPAGLGGENTGANPVEYALGALIGCHVVVYRLYAEALGIRIDSITAEADGDLDVRKLFGLNEDGRPGFDQIRINVSITGPETEERYRELKAAVDEHCPVLDLFQNPTPVHTALSVG
ncbi:OsmC family peroxiredoxin [Mycetocola tolaasinivorans]|uniref:OsmC family peroxiredoxin n=1 Tax=Mycetocola tolaasinivorans TaxID=76635 RepID=A0A3L7A5G3_9MICO|nr:OsmC family protein [Mycetocola tolaasinivorans]RLP75549.1 OsmC family peroxiredoxin [Mycetocola tolaasinivorans]